MASIFDRPKTYLDMYNEKIAPKLAELDLFLKEAEMPLTIWQVSQALDISYNEVKTLMQKLGIYNLNYKNIFYIILNGTSSICKMIQKEKLLGFPTYYTAPEISYIYDIDKEKINCAFTVLGFDKIESARIPEVFAILRV